MYAQVENVLILRNRIKDIIANNFIGILIYICCKIFSTKTAHDIVTDNATLISTGKTCNRINVNIDLPKSG